MPWIRVHPVVTRSAKKRSSWCRAPYPHHPKGCPNYGKKIGCPPRVKLLWEIIRQAGDCWAIYNAFDIAAHAKQMRAAHPNWSDAQIYCCLYWQPRARKQLMAEIRWFCNIQQRVLIVRTPEACGVDLTATMKTAEIELEWPPRQIAYQIVLAGIPCHSSRHLNRVKGKK